MVRTAFDVIVAGGGPAGSVIAWDLARRGVKVLLLERERFPREKVCGDYVEPRGLRILQSMGCLERLERSERLPITESSMYVEGHAAYRGTIPFYGNQTDLPPHGYIVPRDVLDNVLLEAAAAAGARVEEETAAAAATLGPIGVEIDSRRSGRTTRRRAMLAVGADGVNSVIARSADLLADDERYIAVARRAYAEGVEGDVGEAVFWFDEGLFPGYGWMFPMPGGRVNVGVGILAETRRKLDIHVPDLFDRFLDELRRRHPRAAHLQLSSAPIGGIVKTYGSAGPNHADGAVLIGDAGSFVDPMTGEGITPAMESALLASTVVVKALEQGRFDAGQLAPFESGFRAYFDPAMTFLDVLAATLRNRYLARPWLTALARGCEIASNDDAFARTSGAFFGGLDVRPPGILGQVWLRVLTDVVLAWPRSLGVRSVGTSLTDLVGWQAAWWRSVAADPVWHTRWMMDLQRKWLRVLPTLRQSGPDPRAAGLMAGLGDARSN
jgi:geranylgeranyl reductase family protein